METNFKIRLGTLGLGVALLAFQSPANTQQVSLSVGSGTDGDIAQVSLITNNGFWSHQTSGGLKLRAQFESTLSQIDGTGSGGNKGITVLGVTPTITLTSPESPGYLEFGIGAHYFDEKQINSRKSVGTHFEFGDFLGFGLRLGSRQQFEVGYRVIHFSNAGISTNNPGLDFHQVRFGLIF